MPGYRARLAGPARFDIDAKLPAGANRTQVPEMLQSLLADRFRLKFHNGSKEFPVYALVVAAQGLKLKDLTKPGDTPDAKAAVESSGYGGPAGMGGSYSDGSPFSLGDNKFEGKKLTMARIASILSPCLDLPIVDMTQNQGKFDISIALSEEDYHGMHIRSAVNAGVLLPPETLRLI